MADGAEKDTQLYDKKARYFRHHTSRAQHFKPKFTRNTQHKVEFNWSFPKRNTRPSQAAAEQEMNDPLTAIVVVIQVDCSAPEEILHKNSRQPKKTSQRDRWRYNNIMRGKPKTGIEVILFTFRGN